MTKRCKNSKPTIENVPVDDAPSENELDTDIDFNPLRDERLLKSWCRRHLSHTPWTVDEVAALALMCENLNSQTYVLMLTDSLNSDEWDFREIVRDDLYKNLERDRCVFGVGVPPKAVIKPYDALVFLGEYGTDIPDWLDTRFPAPLPASSMEQVVPAQTEPALSEDQKLALERGEKVRAGASEGVV